MKVIKEIGTDSTCLVNESKVNRNIKKKNIFMWLALSGSSVAENELFNISVLYYAHS